MKWSQADPGAVAAGSTGQGVHWPDIVTGLPRIGCRVWESDGFNLSVERSERVAMFHHGAVGTAYGYQLAALKAFLEETK